MARRRHSPDQIIAKLRDADVMLADGMALAQIAKQLEVTEQTYYRWRNQYGGMKGPEMKRLKDLEKENGRLKRPRSRRPARDVDRLARAVEDRLVGGDGAGCGG